MGLILGLDHGYNFTKTSEKVMFLSTIKEGKDIDINKDTIQVNLNSKDYIVGTNDGDYAADNNKVDSLVTEVTTFTAIAKSFPDYTLIECNLIVGLPVGYYAKQKEAFKDKLLNYGSQRITVNGHSTDIRIISVDVYPQSVGVIFQNSKDIKNEDSLVIDIGGNTVDCSQFHGLKLVNKSTHKDGMLVLYSDLAQKISSDNDINIEKGVVDEKLMKGYINTTLKGKVDLKPYREYLRTHANKIANNIKYDFKDYGSMDNIFIIGGGGIRLYEYIKEIFPSAVLCEDAQFSNANAYKLMGTMKNI